MKRNESYGEVLLSEMKWLIVRAIGLCLCDVRLPFLLFWACLRLDGWSRHSIAGTVAEICMVSPFPFCASSLLENLFFSTCTHVLILRFSFRLNFLSTVVYMLCTKAAYHQFVFSLLSLVRERKMRVPTL